MSIFYVYPQRSDPWILKVNFDWYMNKTLDQRIKEKLTSAFVYEWIESCSFEGKDMYHAINKDIYENYDYYIRILKLTPRRDNIMFSIYEHILSQYDKSLFHLPMEIINLLRQHLD